MQLICFYNGFDRLKNAIRLKSSIGKRFSSNVEHFMYIINRGSGVPLYWLSGCHLIFWAWAFVSGPPRMKLEFHERFCNVLLDSRITFCYCWKLLGYNAEANIVKRCSGEPGQKGVFWKSKMGIEHFGI